MARIHGDAGEVASTLPRSFSPFASPSTDTSSSRDGQSNAPTTFYCKVPARLMDEDMLAVIARSATSIHCECPTFGRLAANFMGASRAVQCAVREPVNADDAALHRDFATPPPKRVPHWTKHCCGSQKAEGIKFLNWSRSCGDEMKRKRICRTSFAASCSLPFSWRKKWRLNWEQVEVLL